MATGNGPRLRQRRGEPRRGITRLAASKLRKTWRKTGTPRRGQSPCPKAPEWAVGSAINRGPLRGLLERRVPCRLSSKTRDDPFRQSRFPPLPRCPSSIEARRQIRTVCSKSNSPAPGFSSHVVGIVASVSREYSGSLARDDHRRNHGQITVYDAARLAPEGLS